MSGRERDNWLLQEVLGELRNLSHKLDNLLVRVLFVSIMVGLMGLAVGLGLGSAYQKIADCGEVNEAVLNEAYYEGYRDGYVAAVQDIVEKDLASIACSLDETITINIDGHVFRVVCEDGGS